LQRLIDKDKIKPLHIETKKTTTKVMMLDDDYLVKNYYKPRFCYL